VAVTARSRRQVEASGQAVASCSSGGPVEIAGGGAGLGDGASRRWACVTSTRGGDRG
jgi:hypothetical protein